MSSKSDRRPEPCVLAWLVAAALLVPTAIPAQTRVRDIFGRELNERGITLVDWDGYLANPLIRVDVLPPTNAALPGSATLSASGARLYFDTPGDVGANGPRKTISLTGANTGVPVRLGIFPDRDGTDEDYTLRLVFTGANGSKATNTVPIHVVDQDLPRTNDFIVSVNFDRDVTGFFAPAARRDLTRQAADDWAYFFVDMNLDPVAVGTEMTFIWSNNFNGGVFFANTNRYRGYQLYAYGTTNVTHRSGGEGSFAGPEQTRGGQPLGMKRSGGYEAEINGNFNTLGWLLLTNDSDWHITGNLGHETNDFYSIAHHEIGHAMIFNPAHSGFNRAKTARAFRSAAVTNYYGGPVPIDAFDHLDGVIDPESRQGVFGYEYFGDIPRRRWLPTKLDLLCAQEVGYELRPSSAFAPLTFPSNTLPAGAIGADYRHTLAVTGGIPFYHWEITAGHLPPGLALDAFTGAVTGTPTMDGTFDFSVRVRDYHVTGAGLTNRLRLVVNPSDPVRLSLTLIGPATNRQAQLLVRGAAGQRQVIEASSNLLTWHPLTTNLLGVNPFQFLDNAPQQHPARFYRALVLP